MMGYSSFSFCINLALFTLFLFVSAKAINNHNLLQNSNFQVHRTQAQIFIRGLNLSSRPDANIVNDEPLDNESEIVENPFRFPFLGGDYKAGDSAGTNNITYLGHHAGYVILRNSTKGRARMSYYYFEARENKAKAPVVVWLSGGPGCSSSLALFYENGPFHLTNKNLSLHWNDYGWDQVSNLLYIDQPTGTGFSYSTKKSDIPTTSEEAAVYFYDFVQAFFQRHPELTGNDVYITGESYAGHYIPAFAAQVQHGNKNKVGRHINLKGLAIGNGLTNPGVQIAAYPDYAKQMKLINQSVYTELKPLVSECLEEAKNVCGDGIRYNRTACAQASIDCNVIFETIDELNPGLNYYDIRSRNCTGQLCYDFSGVGRFLNQAEVKRALGVDESMDFVSCSGAVQDAMSGDWMRNLAVYVPELLEDGIKLLLYVGEYDLVCNWLGNSEWVHEMKWSGQRDFNSTSYIPFIVDNTEAGLQKSYANLTFLKVHNAGHLVPMDQPKPALQMLGRWMQGHIPL